MSIVCTLRSPSETRRSRILPADAPGAKGFLSLSIRTAPRPPRAPREQPAPGEPGCGSPDLRGLRAQASRLGSVACSRVTFYHSFDKRLVEAFTFKLVPRQWTETRSGLPGGRRKEGPPVTQGRGRSPPPPAGTRAVSQRWAPGFRGLDARRGDPQRWRDRAQPSAPSRAHAASAPPASLQTHRRQRTARHAERPARLARGFRRERQEHRPRAARGVFRVRGRRDPWHRAGCTGCGLPPSPGLAVGARALPPASYGPERARQRLSLFPAPLPVNEVTRRPWVVTPG